MKIRVVLSCLALSLPAAMAVSNMAKADTSTGVASFYWQGRSTASGERFNPSAMTAAHRSLPFGTKVLVTNLKNGKSVIVRINDRGPYVAGREIDLSAAAARTIGVGGVATVRIDILRP